MKYLRIISKGWAGYSGYLGQVKFEDGVSVDPVPRVQADRIAGTFSVVEVDADGNEVQAGAAARLVGGATIPAPIAKPLVTVSEEELADERAKQAEKIRRQEKLSQVRKIYTHEELEKIADREGIKGLRDIAAPYGVKGRSIPELIKDVIDAQARFKQTENGERIAASSPDNEPAPAEEVSAVGEGEDFPEEQAEIAEISPEQAEEKAED